MSEAKILRSNCRACARGTRHELVHDLLVETREDFINECDNWQIIRCLGCFTVAFRHQNDDFDDVEEQSDGSVRHAVTAITYPRVIANHRGLRGTFYLPKLIKTIYEQTLRALGEQAHVLASIG